MANDDTGGAAGGVSLGTLGVTNGGTGANLGATGPGLLRQATSGAAVTVISTSSDLRATIADETGTGALTFATSPTLVTPILGTPTSGTLTNCTGLPVATGISGMGANVATFLATPSSANLAAALTDETGTGANVFANSPVLVTPNLGTPSAVTLTNGTGLPVSTGISGFAAGVATFLATPTSANLAAAVTDETGTGALVFASSPAIVTPTIASFTNATHNHTNAAGGGQITTAALSNYTEWTDFTPTRGASAGTWTGGTVVVARYKRNGKSLFVAVEITASTTSTTPVYLTITVPASLTAATATNGYLDGFASTAVVRGCIWASGTELRLYSAPARTGTWAAAGDVFVSFVYHVETTT